MPLLSCAASTLTYSWGCQEGDNLKGTRKCALQNETVANALVGSWVRRRDDYAIPEDLQAQAAFARFGGQNSRYLRDKKLFEAVPVERWPQATGSKNMNSLEKDIIDSSPQRHAAEDDQRDISKSTGGKKPS